MAQGIKSDIILNDQMSPVLRDMARRAKEVTRAMGDMEKSGKGLDDLEKEFKKATKAAAEAEGAVQVTGRALEKLCSDIAVGSAALDSLKGKFNNFKSTVQNVGNVLAHPFKNLNKLIQSVRSSVGSSISSFKNLAKTKFGNIKTGLKDVKTTLTGDKQGATGFKNVLANIGRMSVGKVFSGFSKLKTVLSAGKAKAKEMASGLKTAAKTNMGKLASGLGKVASKLGSIAKTAAGAAFNGLKKVAGVSFKAIGAGVGVAVGAVAKLTKSAVESYSNYEQLKGGVETLFGNGGLTLKQYAKQEGQTIAEASGKYKQLTAAQNEAFKNANNAYKTAGMSANEYMEVSTGFAASLVSSLGGDTNKAVKYADMAVIDMADNANKMGSDIESIKNAYQGFAKGQFNMLDNLKLGYGGTKEEMQKLLKEAQKISGQKYDISSFADITQAIHVMQKKMNIAGTTANEAEGTIQGSLGMMKSSWQNMLTALVSGGDQYDQCVDNLVNSVSIAAQNLMPAIEGALNGVGALITDLAPIIAERLPSVINDVLPSLLSAVTTIFSALGSALPGIITALVQILPTILPLISQAFGTILNVLLENAPLIIPPIISALLMLVDVIIENLPLFIDVAMQLVTALIQGLAEKAPELVPKIFDMVTSMVKVIWDNAGEMLKAGENLLKGLWDGISNKVEWVIGKVKDVGSKIMSKIKSVFGIHSPSKEFAKVGDYLMQGLGDGVTDNAKYAVTATQSVAKDVLAAANGLNANAQIGATFTGVTGSVSDLDGGTYDIMRNYAAQDSVNKFTTAQVNINMGGVTNQIASGEDVDDLITQFVEGVREKLSTASQGVH